MNLNRPINISLKDAAGEQKHFENLGVYLKFLKTECEFWGRYKERLDQTNNAHPFLNFSSNLKQVIKVLEDQSTLDDYDDAKLNQVISNLQSKYLAQSNSQWLWSGHEFTPRFIEILEDNSKAAASSFFKYLVSNQVDNLSNRSNFEGAILAYEFHHQNSDLVKRRTAERSTITKLRTELQAANDDLISEVTATKDDFTKWSDETQKQYDDWKSELEEKTRRLGNVNKRIAERKGKKYDKAVTKQFDAWKARFGEIEHTFREKIRLEKPAQYWKNTADKLRKQGFWLTIATSLVAVLGILGVGCLFVKWLDTGEQIINLASIQGAVLFATLAAIYAFLVRILSRLAFSSFHLMRDAEEREQLTYLYLSLSEDAEVDSDSRNIVLQALFSRSETGLLGQDSGPTMPGAGDLLKRFSGSK